MSHIMIECPVFCYRHDVANATNDTGVAFMLTASQEKKKKRLAQVLSFISQNLFFFFSKKEGKRRSK